MTIRFEDTEIKSDTLVPSPGSIPDAVARSCPAASAVRQASPPPPNQVAHPPAPAPSRQFCSRVQSSPAPESKPLRQSSHYLQSLGAVSPAGSAPYFSTTRLRPASPG